VLVVDCKYSITVAFSKRQSQWWLVTTCLQHNHDISEDPIVFSAHKDRNPDRQQAVEIVTGLKHAHTTFRQAQATMTHIGLDLNAYEYNNFMRSGGRMSSEDQLRCALRGLELKRFHVRCLQKYVVEEIIDGK